MTLHAPQVHGFFSVPVDHLHALREIAGHFGRQDLDGAVVVSPDLGNAKRASVLARMLGLPVAAGAKERHSDDHVTISSIIGDVADRDVIVLDDEMPGAPRSSSCSPGCASTGPAPCGSPAPTGCSPTAR